MIVALMASSMVRLSCPYRSQIRQFFFGPKLRFEKTQTYPKSHQFKIESETYNFLTESMCEENKKIIIYLNLNLTAKH